MDESLLVLWPDGAKNDRLLVLLSDAASYMIKASEALKVFYPNLLHVTCFAHGVNRVAEQIRSMFPDVNDLISKVKKV